MNAFIYIILMVLTVCAFPAARHPSILIAFAGCKCLLVGFFYMDLRRAHLAWRLGFIGFVVVMVISLLILS